MDMARDWAAANTLVEWKPFRWLLSWEADAVIVRLETPAKD
jgi:hypothetical protein